MIVGVNVNRAIISRCLLIVAVCGVVLSGCVKPKPVKLPPVSDGWKNTEAFSDGYVVQRGDTVYSIAWGFGLDYQKLVRANRLVEPYQLTPGEKIKLCQVNKAEQVATYQHQPVNRSSLKEVSNNRQRDNRRLVADQWLWPAEGELVTDFDGELGKSKGIDIMGTDGDVVSASKCGTVVYCGSGLRAYGKLIIVKHDNDYLSAYAYNQEILVREGQVVNAGQKIATMGRDYSGVTKLHFEIRRFGNPVDPLKYLPEK